MSCELGQDLFDKITANPMGRKGSKRGRLAMHRTHGQGAKGKNPTARERQRSGQRREGQLSENRL